MYVSIISAEDLEVLETAIEAALDEAAERGMSLTVSDVTVRLFEAYAAGERDPERLADAVVFEGRKHQLH